MFRFKLGVAVGFGLGWLVVSGKAAALIEQFRQRRQLSGAAPAGTIKAATLQVHGADDSAIYDFATRAAE